MRRPSMTLVLVAGCFGLALAQRPGDVVADTKVDLYVDAARFLNEVASAWTPAGSLGHVFGGQYGGYLFPMAPWFALGDAAGLPVWIVHRLWLGALLALAGYGVLRLLDALAGRPRTALHAAAAALYVLNPYVAVYTNRTSVALLAYAALPWLLLAVHRGLRDPRGWRWPAVFALALTCTAGGINAATTGWLLLGPALLLGYELLVGGVARRAVAPFLLRLAPVTALANVWWVLPVVAHARYGLDFLPFTEQPGTIWGPSSVTEALRLMGFWTSYIGVGFGGTLRPFASHGPALLFEPLIVLAGLAVPALALGGFAWTRRWRYAPFFLLLVLVGVLVMVAGFPEGSPLRRALTGVYYHVQPLQFLRTTYKAGPLVALGIAVLGGAAFALAWERLRGAGARVVLTAGVAVLAAVAAWPLASGRAPERQLVFDVPDGWRDAAAAVDRLPDGERAVVLPGQLFAYYEWGGTIDPILPTLARRPVAERTLVPYADLRSVDLAWEVDSLVSQERLVRGQLPPLLDLLGAGAVVVAGDRDRARAGALGTVEARRVLAREPSLRFGSAFGARRVRPPEADRVAAPLSLPRVALGDARTDGMVRVVPRAPGTVVDGGAGGVVGLAAFGALDPRRPLAYAADLDVEVIRRAARDGGELVVTDTNRRRAFVASRLRANTGHTLTPGEEVSEDGAMLDPFDRGPDAQTVAVVGGGVRATAPYSPQVTQFPEHRPFAALDGDPRTAWIGDRVLPKDRHHLDVTFDRPRDVPMLQLLPYDDSRGVVERVAVNGREFAVRPGWNTLRVGLRDVRELTVRIVRVRQPRVLSGGAGGIRELRIPGVRATEALRPPVLVERALRGADTSRATLTYLLSRTTVDAPSHAGPPIGPWQAGLLRDRVDPERRLTRTIAPPAARRWRLDAWVSAGPATRDDALDRLAGARGEVVTTSSGRYQGLPGARASSAFDGDGATAWLGPWGPGARPELRWRTAAPVTVRRLRLVAPRETVRRATRVRLNGTEYAVGAGGVVTLAAPLRARSFALTVLDARFPPGATGRERRRRAVGIAEVRGVPGARLVVPRRGPLRGRCGDASVRTAAGVVALRPRGDVRALDAGEPLRAASCGAAVALPAGRQAVVGGDGVLRVDHLRLRSPAARPVPFSPLPAGRVLDAGTGGEGERDGVRVDVRAPAWLVYGESYNRGWRATCDGRSLGAPVPLQGYANAWRVEPGCRDVSFAWAPDRALPYGYAISLVTCLALVALLLVRRRREPSTAPADLPDDPAPRRWTPRRALAAGAIAGVVLAGLFALRAGVVLGPAVAFVLWRGVSARQLALAGGFLLLVAVPIGYLLAGGDRGGYDTNYANERIAAHWFGVAAVCCLGAALWRTLAVARRPGGG